MAQLSYAEVSAITYRATDIIIRLSPEQQSLLVQAIAIFNDGYEWADYEQYSDDIDALVAASEYALQVEETPLNRLINIDLWTANGIVTGSTITYFNAAFMPFNYVMFSDNLAGRMMRNTGIWLSAGTYAYSGWHSKSSTSGITGILLFDASGVYLTIIATIDEYNAAFNARFNVTATFTVADDGFYDVVAMNNGTKNAASGGYAVNWTSHHIRQTS